MLCPTIWWLISILIFPETRSHTLCDFNFWSYSELFYGILQCVLQLTFYMHLKKMSVSELLGEVFYKYLWDQGGSSIVPNFCILTDFIYYIFYQLLNKECENIQLKLWICLFLSLVLSVLLWCILRLCFGAMHIYDCYVFSLFFLPLPLWNAFHYL